MRRTIPATPTLDREVEKQEGQKIRRGVGMGVLDRRGCTWRVELIKGCPPPLS
jgi:hypothetical protein